MPACLSGKTSGIGHQSTLKHISLKYISQWYKIKNLKSEILYQSLFFNQCLKFSGIF